MHGHKTTDYLLSKVWCVAYAIDSLECFEMLTGDGRFPKPTQKLYHKEYPIGTALADFVAYDLDTLEAKINSVRKSVECFNQDSTAFKYLDYIRSDAKFLTKECAFFVPIATALERMTLPTKLGEKMVMDEVLEMVEKYRMWQPRLAYLIGAVFTLDTPADMMTRFFENNYRNDGQQRPLLQFDGASAEWAYYKAKLCYLYNDLFEDYDEEETFDDNPFEEGITEVIHTEKLDDFIVFMLYRYLQNNVRFRTCKNCQRLFGIVGNPKTEYCQRKDFFTKKTCRETGAVRVYERKGLLNPAIREYKRSYKAHNARIRYGLMTKEEFSVWSEEARKQRDACLAGKLSLEDFVAWLDQDKM